MINSYISMSDFNKCKYILQAVDNVLKTLCKMFIIAIQLKKTTKKKTIIYTHHPVYFLLSFIDLLYIYIRPCMFHSYCIMYLSAIIAVM